MSKSGRAAVARSRSIDQQLDEERERREKEVQILILGAPGSGKSTVLKQIRLHYGDQFPANERRNFHDHILQNVAFGIVQLLEHMELQGLKFDSLEVEKLAGSFRKKHPRFSIVNLIKKFKEEDDKQERICPVTTKAELTKRMSSLDVYKPELPVVDDMQTLWAEPSVQYCFNKRNTFEVDRLESNTEYFLSHIGRICSEDYTANMQDILQIRWPTLGIQEHLFNVDDMLYRMIDVAGQRSLRKKWIHFFEESTAVLFFVALSCYDEVLEDEERKVNALQDGLLAFNEISHSPFLDKSDFILFLNKKDLFAQKLKSTPLSVCFPDYRGNSALDSSIKFVKQQFLQNKPTHKHLYAHASCAVDVGSMKETLGTVIENIAEINSRRNKLL